MSTPARSARPGVLLSEPDPTLAGAVAEIETAMLALARLALSTRTHEHLATTAGVIVDRSGEAVLRQLADADTGLRLGELAQRLGIEAPTASRKVHELGAAGLVVREGDPTDGRACRLRLTPAGESAVHLLRLARRDRLAEVIRGWPPEDRINLGRLLTRLAADVQASSHPHHVPERESR